MIQVDTVDFSYGQHKVLDGVSLNSNDKKFVGIIGPNGSGKSTLLKCMYRVLKPNQGTIYLENTRLNDLNVTESARKISVVAQHNHSSFDFIVEDMVLMGRSPYKRTMEANSQEDYRIVDEALAAVEMLDYKKRSFTSLSGGEMQRIILARALAQEPQCIILDEPTNHLDIKHQLMMLNILKVQNLSVIAAVHDLNIALNYCDYVYVMKDGLIKYEGPAEQVITEAVIEDVFGVKAKILREDNESAILYREVI